MSRFSQSVLSVSCDKTQGCNPLRLHPNLVPRMVVANALFLCGTMRKISPRNTPEGLFLHNTSLQREKKKPLNQKVRTKVLFPRYNRGVVPLQKGQFLCLEDLEGPLEKQKFLSSQETSMAKEDIPWILRKALGKPGIGRRWWRNALVAQEE